MKEKIIITNVLIFENADNGGVRISYLLAGKDRLANNNSFKGFQEVVSYCRDKEVFDNISLDMIGKPLDATFESKTDYKNPLNVKNYLKRIEYNGSTIDLV